MPDRVLVVEDDDATRYAYERALNKAGYKTAGFATYFAAATEIDKGAGALLVIDLQLPPGTPQGVAIARMVRYRRPGIPVIFVTGYPELAEMVDSNEGLLMVKPVDLDLLVTAVRDLLATSPLGRGRAA